MKKTKSDKRRPRVLWLVGYILWFGLTGFSQEIRFDDLIAAERPTDANLAGSHYLVNSDAHLLNVQPVDVRLPKDNPRRYGTAEIYGAGVLFVDLDNDNRPDLFVPRESGQACQIYLNKKNGVRNPFVRLDGAIFFTPNDALTDVVAKDKANIYRHCIGAVAADYDNDGDLDIYVITAVGATQVGNLPVRPGENDGARSIYGHVDGVQTPGPGIVDPAEFNLLLGNILFENRLADDGKLSFWNITDTASSADMTGLTPLEGDGRPFGVRNLSRFEQDGGHFKAGFIKTGLSRGAAWGDVNRDGFPDLYVANHRVANAQPGKAGRAWASSDCAEPATILPMGMRNTLYLNLPDPKNPKRRKFQDITERASVRGGGKTAKYANRLDRVADKEGGWDGGTPFHQALAASGSIVLACYIGHFNEDQWPDIYVVNDGGPCDADALYLNNGRWTTVAPISSENDPPLFREAHALVGVRAGGSTSKPEPDPLFGFRAGNGMGIAVGDFNLDLRNDFYLTDLLPFAKVDEGVNNFYQSMPNGELGGFINRLTPLFAHPSSTSDLHGPSIASADFGWGAACADFDNDGLLDLYSGTNIASQIAPFGTLGDFVFRNVTAPPKDPVQLARVDTRFQRVENSGAHIPMDTRSVATGDFDWDGKVDVFTLNVSKVDLGQPDNLLGPGKLMPHRLLRNISPGNGAWLAVRLVGDTRKPVGRNQRRSSKDALGAMMRIMDIDHDANPKTPAINLRRDVAHGGGNLASMNDRILYFGLGKAQLEDLDYAIVWPDGTISTRTDRQGAAALTRGLNHAYKLTQVRVSDSKSDVKVEVLY